MNFEQRHEELHAIWQYTIDYYRRAPRPAAAVPFIKPATVTITTRELALQISTAKIGGLRFVKVGRICFSYCVTKEYKPL